MLGPQQSSVRRTLRNRPARLGRHRDGPDARSLTRSRSARQAAPAPATARPHPHPGQPYTRRADERTASAEELAPAESGGTGRRPQPQQPAGPRTVLHPRGDGRCSSAPRTGSAGPAPASAVLSGTRGRGELRPQPPGLRRSSHPRRTVAAASPACRPGGPQQSGRPCPGLAQSGGGAGTGREPGAPSGPSPSPGREARLSTCL